MLLRSLRKSVYFFVPVIFMGCATSTSSTVDRDRYLQSFIGQDQNYIAQHLDLRKIGYSKHMKPIIEANRLTYVIERSIRIPVPTVASVGAIPLTLDSNTSYDSTLHCQISFEFQDHIARSFSYSKGTC